MSDLQGRCHEVQKRRVEEVVIDDTRGKVVQKALQPRTLGGQITDLSVDFVDPARESSDLCSETVTLGGPLLDLETELDPPVIERLDFPSPIRRAFRILLALHLEVIAFRVVGRFRKLMVLGHQEEPNLEVVELAPELVNFLLVRAELVFGLDTLCCKLIQLLTVNRPVAPGRIPPA